MLIKSHILISNELVQKSEKMFGMRKFGILRVYQIRGQHAQGTTGGEGVGKTETAEGSRSTLASALLLELAGWRAVSTAKGRPATSCYWSPGMWQQWWIRRWLHVEDGGPERWRPRAAAWCALQDAIGEGRGGVESVAGGISGGRGQQNPSGGREGCAWRVLRFSQSKYLWRRQQLRDKVGFSGVRQMGHENKLDTGGLGQRAKRKISYTDQWFDPNTCLYQLILRQQS